jgi:hypothetical protein
MDVVYALKRQGRTIYGFGGWSNSSVNQIDMFNILLYQILFISLFLILL